MPLPFYDWWTVSHAFKFSTIARPWAAARPSVSVPRKLGRRPPNGEYFFTFLVQRAMDRQKYTPRSAHTRTPGHTRRTNQRRTGITSSLLFLLRNHRNKPRLAPRCSHSVPSVSLPDLITQKDRQSRIFRAAAFRTCPSTIHPLSRSPARRLEDRPLPCR